MTNPIGGRGAVIAAAWLVAAAPAASATDLHVDATGAGGAYTNIDAAMNVARPGDRILVAPGSYPKFDFVVGVSVIGLGDDPSDVVIRRIYFHVNDPNLGYDALLQNVTLRSADPADTLLLHGNEAGPGTLTVDSVRVDGAGVYLRGGQEGFYVHFSNTEIKTQQGYGFSGEACYVGGPGNYVELRNTRITGWDALPAFGLPACHGLRIAGGTQARAIGCEISGGAGGASSDPLLAAGGDGIVLGLTGESSLLLEGATVVTGGAGNGATGGAGVRLDGSIVVGNAQVSGGAGSPSGPAYGLDAPVAAPLDLALTIEPDLEFAAGGVGVKSGDTVKIQVNPGVPAVIALGFGVDVPSSPKLFFPLSPTDPLVWTLTNEIEDTVPSDPQLAIEGLMVYAQAFLLDPSSGKLVLTNSATLRVDML